MKMGILRHIISQPFVASTSIAALVHSTWSLCTFMGGDQPTDPLHLFGWLAPGFLLAFSLDVGLLWTAVSINRKEGGKGMYAAMGVLLLAMFYLQWLYMAIHLPEVSLGAGVRQQWVDAISLGRDLSLFVVPALLPISVGLFTFSRRDAHETTVIHSTETALVTTVEPLTVELPDKDKMSQEPVESGQGEPVFVAQHETVSEVTDNRFLAASQRRTPFQK